VRSSAPHLSTAARASSAALHSGARSCPATPDPAKCGALRALMWKPNDLADQDLPNLHEVSGDPGENIDRLAAFIKDKGIQLV
jgi:hypothetical protein